MRRRMDDNTSREELSPASQEILDATNRKAMEELQRKVIAAMQESPGAAEKCLGNIGMTVNQVKVLLTQPVTPSSIGSLIQLALAIQLPVRIILDVPVQADTNTTRGLTVKSTDGRAIDNF